MRITYRNNFWGFPTWNKLNHLHIWDLPFGTTRFISEDLAVMSWGNTSIEKKGEGGGGGLLLFSLQFLHGYIIYMYICICTYTNIDFKFKFSTPLDKIINFFSVKSMWGLGEQLFFRWCFSWVPRASRLRNIWQPSVWFCCTKSRQLIFF